MILYFTGTGNSRYIAKKLAKETGDELFCINDRIRNNDVSTVFSKDRLVFVTPTYAWRIPAIVMDWIGRTEFTGSPKAWFVMNCGSEIGNAAKYNKELCSSKGFTYMGTAEIVMPENYIAMFQSPSDEEALRIIEKAKPVIEKNALFLKEDSVFPAPRNNLFGKIMSGPVNSLFYSYFVKANAFKTDARCIGCGKCAALCPLHNIELKEKKPVWGSNCTHCMACICSCPTEAIEYGKKSMGKNRYLCRDFDDTERR